MGSGTLSGAAFQKNRLSGISAADSTLFEDDHAAWLLGRPDDVVKSIAAVSKRRVDEAGKELRVRGYAHFRAASKQKEGYPRLKVFEGYQAAALEMLESVPGDLADRARTVREERYPEGAVEELEVPPGFASRYQSWKYQVSLGATTTPIGRLVRLGTNDT